MPQAASKQGTFSGSRRMTVDAQLGGLRICSLQVMASGRKWRGIVNPVRFNEVGFSAAMGQRH
jgi:hypothetical protein